MYKMKYVQLRTRYIRVTPIKYVSLQSTKTKNLNPIKWTL